MLTSDPVQEPNNKSQDYPFVLIKGSWLTLYFKMKQLDLLHSGGWKIDERRADIIHEQLTSMNRNDERHH